MAHTYVVTSVSYVGLAANDPPVTIIGTVDGVAVTVQVWLSAIQQAQASGGLTAVKNLIAPVMLAAAQQQVAQQTQSTVTQLPTGTFSQ